MCIYFCYLRYSKLHSRLLTRCSTTWVTVYLRGVTIRTDLKWTSVVPSSRRIYCARTRTRRTWSWKKIGDRRNLEILLVKIRLIERDQNEKVRRNRGTKQKKREREREKNFQLFIYWENYTSGYRARSDNLSSGRGDSLYLVRSFLFLWLCCDVKCLRRISWAN